MALVPVLALLLLLPATSCVPEMSERDWENVRALGWHSIRLGTAWEVVEPVRDAPVRARFQRRLVRLGRPLG